MLQLGAFHPEYIVEQQFGAIGGGQPLQAQLRPVDKHLAKFTNFGMDAKE